MTWPCNPSRAGWRLSSKSTAHGLDLHPGRERALLPTTVPSMYLSLVQAGCSPGNVPPWEATSSWQTQAVFKQWVQTRPAPAGEVCPGSWHLVSGYPLLLGLVIGEWGGTWLSPPGESCLGPCSGFLVLSPSGETASFHQSLKRSLPVLTRANAVQAICRVFTNLCFGIPGEKEKIP